MLQIANQQGYITIDWNKIHKKVDKVTDKVEEAVTGQGPSWADKVSHSRTLLPPPLLNEYALCLLNPACGPSFRNTPLFIKLELKLATEFVPSTGDTGG